MDDMKVAYIDGETELKSNYITADTPLIIAARKSCRMGLKLTAIIIGLIGSLVLFLLNGYLGAKAFAFLLLILISAISLNSAASFKRPLANLKGFSNNAAFLIIISLCMISLSVADYFNLTEPIKTFVDNMSATIAALIPLELGALGSWADYILPFVAVLTLLSGFSVISIRSIIRKNRSCGFFSFMLFIISLLVAICLFTVTASIVLKFFNILVTPDITIFFGSGYAPMTFYFLASLSFLFAFIYYINIFAKTEKIKNAL